MHENVHGLIHWWLAKRYNKDVKFTSEVVKYLKAIGTVRVPRAIETVRVPRIIYDDGNEVIRGDIVDFPLNGMWVRGMVRSKRWITQIYVQPENKKKTVSIDPKRCVLISRSQANCKMR